MKKLYTRASQKGENFLERRLVFNEESGPSFVEKIKANIEEEILGKDANKKTPDEFITEVNTIIKNSDPNIQKKLKDYVLSSLTAGEDFDTNENGKADELSGFIEHLEGYIKDMLGSSHENKKEPETNADSIEGEQKKLNIELFDKLSGVSILEDGILGVETKQSKVALKIVNNMTHIKASKVVQEVENINEGLGGWRKNNAEILAKLGIPNVEEKIGRAVVSYIQVLIGMNEGAVDGKYGKNTHTKMKTFFNTLGSKIKKWNIKDEKIKGVTKEKVATDEVISTELLENKTKLLTKIKDSLKNEALQKGDFVLSKDESNISFKKLRKTLFLKPDNLSILKLLDSKTKKEVIEDLNIWKNSRNNEKTKSKEIGNTAQKIAIKELKKSSYFKDVVFTEDDVYVALNGKHGDEIIKIHENGGVSIKNKNGESLTGKTNGEFIKKSSYNGAKEFLVSYKEYKRGESVASK